MINWLVATVCIFVLGILTFNVRHSKRFNMYDHLLNYKLTKRDEGVSWEVITFLNDPKLMVVWAVLLAAGLLNEDKNFTALWVLATLGLTDVFGICVKKIVHRRRPTSQVTLAAGYSFPSGHVLGTTTMTLILLHLFGKWGGPSFSLILICGWLLVILSRLNLRAHYPSDVVGAISLAVCCFSLSEQVFTSF